MARKRIHWVLAEKLELWGNKNDSEIADVLGCSRERVRQKRSELKIRKSKKFHRKRNAIQFILEEMGREVVSQKTLTQLADDLKCNRTYVKKTLDSLGYTCVKEYLRRKYRWEVLEDKDWGVLMDRQIQELLGVKHVTMVTQRRSRCKHLKAKISSKKGQLAFNAVQERLLKKVKPKRIGVRFKKRQRKNLNIQKEDNRILSG